MPASPESMHVELVHDTTYLADEGMVFEVFQEDGKDPYPHHGGNLRAPDNELALHYAREFYGRRQESLKLWIIPRKMLLEIRTSALLPTTQRRSEQIQTISESHQDACVIFGQRQSGQRLIWLQETEHLSLQEVEEIAREGLHRGFLRFWLCPRNAILELSNQDLLQPPLDRSYRRLDGYNIREKLARARERVQIKTEGGQAQ